MLFKAEEYSIRGILSADTLMDSDGTHLLSNRRVFLVTGHPDKLQIASKLYATLDGLKDILSSVIDNNVEEDDRDVNPRFTELLVKCKQEIMKESYTNEGTTVINSN